MRRCLLLAAAFQIVCLNVGRIESATAEAPADSPEQEPSKEEPTGDVAVIDVERIFKEHTRFNAEFQKLKDRVNSVGQEIRASAQEIKGLAAKAKAATSPEMKAKLDTQASGLTGALDARIKELREQLLEAEATLYNDTYDEILAEVANYARKHGIRIVRQVEKSPSEIENVTLDKRQEVTKRVNRVIVYINLASSERDITDTIIESLNAKRASDAAVAESPIDE
jgi:Skp family chaperone for outer membrane proteins